MWIKLPSAALVALVTAARGFPWHGAVAGTLGFYVLSAAWALVAHGTRGFLWVVGEKTWWAPAAAFAIATVLTGVPGIRRRLFGARAWSKARASSQGRPAVPNGDSAQDGAVSWAQTLADGATSANPKVWNNATSEVITGHKERTGAELLSDRSSLERRNTGALGLAIAELDACLSTIPAVQPGTARNEAPLSSKQWRQLLSLNAQGSSKGSNPQALTLPEKAELVTRAASHSLAAGHVLAWRWLSGLDEAIETLGTPKQKKTLLPILARNHEIVAAGWTGHSRAPEGAVVVREMRGKDEVLGLRVTCALEGIVGADAATVIAIMVDTSDPNGLLKRPQTSGDELGKTCVLVRPSGGLTLLKGAAMDERLASHSLSGLLHSNEAFVPMDHVLGGIEGVGAADALAERCLDTWETVRLTSLLAGIGQRTMATEGSLTLIRNVMCAETIEAWSHASLGAAAFELNALGSAAALIAEERSIGRDEARALQSTAMRGAHELICRGASQEENAPPRSPEEAFVMGLPHPAAAASEASWESSCDPCSSWNPTWHQNAVAAVDSDSPAAFDLARSEAWRRLFHAGAGAIVQNLPGLSRLRGKRDPKQRSELEQHLDESRAALVRACSAARTAALLQLPSAESSSRSMGVVFGKLKVAEEHLANMTFVELAHRTEGSQPIESGLVLLNNLTELREAHAAVSSAIQALPGRVAKALCRATLRAARGAAQGPNAELAESVAASLVANPEVLRRLLVRSYAGHAENFGTAPLRQAALMASASRVPIAAVQRAQNVGQLPPDEFSTVLDLAVQRRIISSVDTAKIRACMAISQEVLSGPLPQIAQEPARHTA